MIAEILKLYFNCKDSLCLVLTQLRSIVKEIFGFVDMTNAITNCCLFFKCNFGTTVPKETSAKTLLCLGKFSHFANP